MTAYHPSSGNLTTTISIQYSDILTGMKF